MHCWKVNSRINTHFPGQTITQFFSWFMFKQLFSSTAVIEYQLFRPLFGLVWFEGFLCEKFFLLRELDSASQLQLASRKMSYPVHVGGKTTRPWFRITYLLWETLQSLIFALSCYNHYVSSLPQLHAFQLTPYIWKYSTHNNTLNGCKQQLCLLKVIQGDTLTQSLTCQTRFTLLKDRRVSVHRRAGFKQSDYTDKHGWQRTCQKEPQVNRFNLNLSEREGQCKPIKVILKAEDARYRERVKLNLGAILITSIQPYKR